MSFLDRIFAAARDTIVWAGFDLQRGDNAAAQAVVLIDPATGDAYSAGAGTAGLNSAVAITNAYIVRTNFVGAGTGDILTATQFVNLSSGSPVTLATVWRNQTQGADLEGPPLAENIEAIGSQPLSNAQLRASPVPVSVAASVEVEVKNDTGSPVNVAPTSLSYTDVSVASLSTAQAAGTAAVLNPNAIRRALVIVPPADCTLRLASTSLGSGGMPLYGAIPNVFIGGECPSNAIFITGLATGQSVVIWEA